MIQGNSELSIVQQVLAHTESQPKGRSLHAVGPSATGVKMRSRGQRVFGTPVKGSMTNFKVSQMVKTTLHITGSVNGQHHFPDVIDSYCLFLSPFLQLQIITLSPQHYEHDEASCHNSNN